MAENVELTAKQLFLPPLSEFVAGNLRSLLLAFTKSPEGIPRAKEELVEVLSEHAGDPDLEQLISRMESLQPFRHLYVYAIDSGNGSVDVQKALANLKPMSNAGVTAKGDLHYLNCINHGYHLLRLAHSVKNCNYLPSGVDTLKMHTVWFRHPVVIAIKPELGVAEVRFNGFEQSKYTPENDRISYPQIAEWCAQFLLDKLGLVVRGLPLKEPVETLMETYPNEVSQKRRVSQIGRGRILLDVGDADENNDVNDLIKTAFSLRTDTVQSTKAMSGWTAENITVFWPRFKAFTRLDYTGDTPEILFSWKATEHKSLKNLDFIVKRLVEFTELDFSQTRRRLANTLNLTSEVVTALEAAQRANTSPKDALDFLMQLVSAQQLKMVFRVRTTDHLEDVANGWAQTLNALPRTVRTVQGQDINLADPNNIEVGFTAVEASQ